MAGNYFYGFHIGFQVAASVLQAVETYRSHVPRATWTDESKLHMTLLFAGKTYRGGNDLPEFTELCKSAAPLRLSFRGAGTFNGRSGPRVLFAKPVQTDILKQWHKMLGGNPETFTPHLTLAKLQEVGDADSALATAAQCLTGHDFGACFVDELRLYQTMGDGQPYKIVAWHKLIGASQEKYEEAF